MLLLKGTLYDMTVASFECGEVSKELVVYFNDMKKAIILNRSGSMIWNFITKAPEGAVISDTNIARHLQSSYELPEEKLPLLLSDVYDTIMKLSEEGAICLSAKEEYKG